MSAFDGLPALKRLRVFDAVAREGSTAAGARRLGVSQPAVTASLNKLEHELGIALLTRTREGSALTPNGEALFWRTSRFLGQVIEAVSQLTGASAHAAGLARKIRETELAALLAIWRTGGFRRAAMELGVTEPSLQRPARELERLLGVSLYRRAGANLEANAAGSQLAKRLSLALIEAWSGVEEAGAVTTHARASLRVGVLALTPRVFLAQAMCRLLSAFPAYRIDVIEASYTSLESALGSGAVDVVFGALRGRSAPMEHVEQRLFEDPYVLACRAGHPLLSLQGGGGPSLSQFEFVFPTEGLPRRAALDLLLKKWDVSPKGRIDTSCLATIVALLHASDRLTILTRWHVDSGGWSALRPLDNIEVSSERRFIGLTTRRSWSPTPFQRAFISEITNSVAERMTLLGG